MPIRSWHADEGISGGCLDRRVGLLDAIDAIRKGDALIVAKRDRLARDVLLSCWIEKEVAKRGGRVVSAAGEGTDGDEPTAVLMRRIVDAFSEYERLVIAARTKAALAVKRSRGERISRHTPYGYDLAPDGSTLTENAAEQAVILDMARDHETGTSLAGIARKLNKAGVRPKRGREWSHKAVGAILRRYMKGATE